MSNARTTSELFHTCHTDLLAGRFEGLAQRLESLSRSANRDMLADPSAYPRLAALPEGMFRPLADRVREVNRSAGR